MKRWWNLVWNNTVFDEVFNVVFTAVSGAGLYYGITHGKPFVIGWWALMLGTRILLDALTAWERHKVPRTKVVINVDGAELLKVVSDEVRVSARKSAKRAAGL